LRSHCGSSPANSNQPLAAELAIVTGRNGREKGSTTARGCTLSRAITVARQSLNPTACPAGRAAHSSLDTPSSPRPVSRTAGARHEQCSPMVGMAPPLRPVRSATIER
jgi:hypothetical protein